MMASIQTYVRRGQRLLRQWALNPRLHVLAETAGFALAGMLFSAASLRNQPLPLTLCLLCVCEGWQAVLVGLGGCVGYLLFWSDAGLQGLLWMFQGLLAALLLGKRRLVRELPLLMSAVAALIVSGSGVIFQIWMADTTPIPMYLLRVALSAGVTRLYAMVLQREHPAADWLACSTVVLALAQVVPIPYLGLGFLAAGIFCAVGSFPTAALAGMALDLAQVTPVPMTAVVCLAYLVKLLPRAPKWLPAAALGAACLGVMGLCSLWDFSPLPGLVLGGMLGLVLPQKGTPVHRRGETGVVQVRLELASGVLAQTEQLLLETPETPIDEQALLDRAMDRACSGCPCRKGCKDAAGLRQLSPELLHHTLVHREELPVTCRKSGRLLLELQRSQEMLRGLRANRDRMRECRWAVIQQYQFLAEYLRELSDRLARKAEHTVPRYRPEIAALSVGRDIADGDRCQWFAGVDCRYYALLCDGMGTGLGAAQESRDAVTMLRRMLTAGYPPEYALRSLNSLCALRGRAGAVTADLAELQLDTGRATLYKWGAAPSWLIGKDTAEKIGTAGPPPGLSVADGRETVERLSLRRGETLVLVSDGVDGEVIQRRAWDAGDRSPGELAASILKLGRGEGNDDATAVVIRLSPEALST